MKNTRKISIALVIAMVLMMALAVIPASAASGSTWYVAGNSSYIGANWTANDGNNKMTLSSGTTYVKSYTNVPTGSYAFKVTNGGWNTAYGDNGGDYKFRLVTGNSKNVTIGFNTNGDKIYVYATEFDRTQKAVVYVKNSSNWSNVYAHSWSGDGGTSWPGTKAVLKDSANKIYQVEVTAGRSMIIFHNNSGTQTSNLLIPTNQCSLYDIQKNTWSVYHAETTTTTTVEASCASAGTKVETCNACGTVVSTTEIPALEHNYVDGFCTICNGKDPNGCAHEYTYACDKACNKCFEITREEAEHTINHVEAVAATCTENGNIEYWYCSDCGYAWTDEALEQQTNQMSTIVPAAHSYTYPCDIACQVCYENTNPDAKHTIAHVDAKDATCAVNGNVEYWYCSDCGYAWADEALEQQTNQKSVIVPALGHSYVDGKCECGSIDLNYTVSVYFENNWSWTNICVYYWGEGVVLEWPGIKLTDADIVGANDQGYKIYKIEVPAYVSGLVFSGDGQYGNEQCNDILPGKDGKMVGCVCYYMTYDSATNTKPAVAYEYGHVAGAAATCTTAQLCTECGKELVAALGHSYSYPCDAHCMVCYELTNEDATHNIVHFDAVPATDCQTYDGKLEFWGCESCGSCWLDEALTQQTNRMSLATTGAHQYMYPCDAHCMVCYELTNEDATHNIVHVDALAPTCCSIGNIEYWYCSDCGSAWTDEALTRITNVKAVKLGTVDHSYNIDGQCKWCDSTTVFFEYLGVGVRYKDKDGKFESLEAVDVRVGYQLSEYVTAWGWNYQLGNRPVAHANGLYKTTDNGSNIVFADVVFANLDKTIKVQIWVTVTIDGESKTYVEEGWNEIVTLDKLVSLSSNADPAYTDMVAYVKAVLYNYDPAKYEEAYLPAQKEENI